MTTDAPILEAAGHRYRWHDDFVLLPLSSRSNGRTHAAAELSDGRVVVFHQSNPAVLVCNADGEVLNAWGDYVGAHGMTLLEHPDGPHPQTLLLTDQGTGAVHECTPDGELLREVPPPPANRVPGGAYMPTWAAVGPDGSTWVADGYGSSLVFRFDAGGTLVEALDGTEGAGRFDCPHGIAFDPEGRLWIADRGNRRITLYDAEGRHLSHSDAACHSPCMFIFDGGRVYVPELHTGVKVLTPGLEVLGDLGVDRVIAEAKTHGTPPPTHWPNQPRSELAPGRFHTPHGLCVCGDGSLIVCEWIVGGRVTKLERLG